MVIIAYALSSVGRVAAPTSSATTAYPSTNPTASVAPAGNASAANVMVLNLYEKEYSITPNVIKVSPGQRVVLRVFNIGTTSHSLTVSGAGFLASLTPTLIPTGGNATLTFTAPAAGNYTYYSPVSNDQSLGMTGTFLVSSAQPSTSTSSTSTAQTTPSTSTAQATSTSTSTSTRSTTTAIVGGGGGWG